jgi:hypothetical protein
MPPTPFAIAYAFKLEEDHARPFLYGYWARNNQEPGLSTAIVFRRGKSDTFHATV